MKTVENPPGSSILSTGSSETKIKKHLRADVIGGQGLDDEPCRAQPLALNLAPAGVVPALRSGSSLRHSSFDSAARWRPRHSMQEQAAQHWLDSLAVRHDPLEWPDLPLCA